VGKSEIAATIGVEKMREIDTPTAMEFIGRSWVLHVGVS
jgi:hypothetical protein